MLCSEWQLDWSSVTELYFGKHLGSNLGNFLIMELGQWPMAIMLQRMPLVSVWGIAAHRIFKFVGWKRLLFCLIRMCFWPREDPSNQLPTLDEQRQNSLDSSEIAWFKLRHPLQSTTWYYQVLMTIRAFHNQIWLFRTVRPCGLIKKFLTV